MAIRMVAMIAPVASAPPRFAPRGAPMSRETVSQMTKAEILSKELHKDRLVHREGWDVRLRRILASKLRMGSTLQGRRPNARVNAFIFGDASARSSGRTYLLSTVRPRAHRLLCGAGAGDRSGDRRDGPHPQSRAYSSIGRRR